MATTSSVPFEGEQEQREQKQEPRIYDVTEGLKSKHTKTAYRIAFNHFLEITIKSRDLRALLDTKQKVIEDKIIDHLTYLKDVEGLTYRSILALTVKSEYTPLGLIDIHIIRFWFAPSVIMTSRHVTLFLSSRLIPSCKHKSYSFCIRNDPNEDIIK